MCLFISYTVLTYIWRNQNKMTKTRRYKHLLTAFLLTEEGMSTTSTHSRWEYFTFSVLLFHWTQCLTKSSFTFLTTVIFDSSFLKVQCVSLISLVKVFIVLLVCSRVVQKKLISFVLFKVYCYWNFILMSPSSSFNLIVSTESFTYSSWTQKRRFSLKFLISHSCI